MNRQSSAHWFAPAIRGAAAAAAGLCLVALLACPAPAVTITGSTYASDTGDPHLPASPQSKSFNIFNATSASNSIRSDVTTAHAQSLSSASITTGALVKSTSGRGWLDTTAPLYNNRGDLWNASASGTQLILNGPPGGSAPFTFSIPGSTLVPAIQFPADSPGDPSTMHPAQTGQQGFFANNGSLDGSPTTLPAFMDEYLHVDATIRVGASVLYEFNGDLTYNPGDNTVVGTGDFLTLAQNAMKKTITNGTGPLYSLNLPDLIAPNIMIPANTPFDAIINVSMSMGDPSMSDPALAFNGGPPASNFPAGFLGTDTSGLPSDVGPIGAGGSFAAIFSLQDSSGQYSLAVVPEPSSLLLAAIGLAAAFGLRRRLPTC